ncbi:MAG: 3'(2'),5'-bisphosphate nucleotidase CysQ [Alphaproteobacteria bacterium]|nr:3'(2'),5'-bisphosphate nucleotidase CysQ [Alphaproteobacteria bacterium]
MLSSQARELAEIAWEAGKLILDHYGGQVEARSKSDSSPVTIADEEAEALILARLRALWPQIPVVAEEEVAAGRRIEVGQHFFLVDPLDGTKEFLNRNGEFTVNIGEIRDRSPIRGVVYAPAQGRMWIGDGPNGAVTLGVRSDVRPDLSSAVSIRARRPPADGMIAVASRSHRDSKTDEYLAHYPIKDFLAAGSSLKFCLVAAGSADIYPRHGTTMEWDTAAGHAVLAAAGGRVETLDGAPLLYGKPNYQNPYFVARGPG